MKVTMPEVEHIPAQARELRGAQAVPAGEQDHGGRPDIPVMGCKVARAQLRAQMPCSRSWAVAASRLGGSIGSRVAMSSWKRP